MSIRGIREIIEQFKYLQRNPFLNLPITIGLPNENDILKWRISMLGPKDTPYKNGYFLISMDFTRDYPIYHPNIHFITPIYHLNVFPKKTPTSPPGEICLAIFSRWNPSYKIEDILVSIYALFYMVNPDSPFSLNRENEYRNNRTLYEEKIRYFTNKYANVRDFIHCTNVEINGDWDFSYNP